MDEGNILSSIVATKTVIDTMDYRGVTSENRAIPPRRVGEGAQIPQTVLKLKDNLIRLVKRGRMLVSSREAVRHQKLDLFTIALRQMGSTMARAQLADAIGVLMDGDGNKNPAKTLETAANTVTYTDLVNLWKEFEEYQMNTPAGLPRRHSRKLWCWTSLRTPAPGISLMPPVCWHPHGRHAL